MTWLQAHPYVPFLVLAAGLLGLAAACIWWARSKSSGEGAACPPPSPDTTILPELDWDDKDDLEQAAQLIAEWHAGEDTLQAAPERASWDERFNAAWDFQAHLDAMAADMDAFREYARDPVDRFITSGVLAETPWCRRSVTAAA
jgi:hypothetical protein